MKVIEQFFQISKQSSAIINNFISNYTYQLTYIVEPADWIIKNIGETITDNLNCKQLLKSRTAINYRGIRNHIIHFGSIHTMNMIPHPSNKVILSWFHVAPNSHKNEFIKQNIKTIDIIHTSSNITKNALIKMGIPSKIIKVLPLGVDLKLFKPLSSGEKGRLRRKLKLPNNKFIIGSFQKDGSGWGEGLTPKLIKGPDVLVQVLKRLSKKLSIFVLLTGPSRGYVKKQLKKYNIDFHYRNCENYQDIVPFIQASDLCLITSRIEGGPKQLLEAMACGVPVITTRVGMVPDIITHNKEALVADVDNIKHLVKYTEILINNYKMKKELAICALKKVKQYSWKEVAKQYYQKLYAPLFKSLTK